MIQRIWDAIKCGGDDILKAIFFVAIFATAGAAWSIGANFHRDAVIIDDPYTGCEYVEAEGSGITPRLDANGKPMCSGGDQ